MTISTANRRAHVRFSDDVMIGLVLLDDVDEEAEFVRLSQQRADLDAGEQAAQRPRMAQAIDEISRSSPDIAAYLNYLERRIDALSSELARNRPLEADVLEPRRINLSAQGLRTENREQLQAGQRVAVSLMLLPRGERVVAIGRVVRTEPLDEAGPAWASIEFTRLSESDRTAIVRRGHRLEQERRLDRPAGEPAD